MQIKRQNSKICKVSLGGNDNIKNLQKYSKLKLNAEKEIKKKKKEKKKKKKKLMQV